MTLYEPKAITPGKGFKGKNCNVTHCQKPESAKHFNRVTRAWYCFECASRIEASANLDGNSWFTDLKVAPRNYKK